MNCFIFIEANFSEFNMESIKYVNQLGLKSIFFCKNKNQFDHYNYRYFDEVIELNTTDIKSLLNASNFILKKYRILGVTSLNEDFENNAASLCEFLKLPSNKAINISIMNNRYKLREMLKKMDPNLNPKYSLSNNILEAELFAKDIGYPCVMKSLLRNKEIFSKKLDNENDLKEYFEENNYKLQNIVGDTFGKGVLIESMIEGNEYSVHFIKSIDGRLVLTGVFIKEVIQIKKNHFLDIATVYPANYDETDLLFKRIAPIIHELGFDVGAIQVNCKIENSAVKILDIIPSLNNNPLASQMIEISTGMKLSHLVIDLALGQNINWYPESLKVVAIYKLLLPNNGVFKGIKNLHEFLIHPNMEAINFHSDMDKWVHFNSLDKEVIGTIIVTHDTAEQALDLARELAAKVEFLIDMDCY